MSMFHETSIIGEIVSVFPKSSDFFKGYRIDFCCGGNRQLIEAIVEKNLPADHILNELNELYEQTRNQPRIDWRKASNRDLIDFIVNKHHRYLNEELPHLSPYVTKVLRVHGKGNPYLADVYQLFNELKTELEQHLIKEETEDFPLILEMENISSEQTRDNMMKKMNDLLEEHDHAGEIMNKIRKVTNDFTPPKGACGTYRVVYQRLEELESDLFEHIHLENNVLFPRLVVNE